VSVPAVYDGTLVSRFGYFGRVPPPQLDRSQTLMEEHDRGCYVAWADRPGVESATTDAGELGVVLERGIGCWHFLTGAASELDDLTECLTVGETIESDVYVVQFDVVRHQGICWETTLSVQLDEAGDITLGYART